MLALLNQIFDKFYYRKEEWRCLRDKIPDLRMPDNRAHSEGILLFDLPDVTNQSVENLAVTRYFSRLLNVEPRYYQPNIYVNNWSPALRTLARFFSRYLKAPRLGRALGACRGIAAEIVTKDDHEAAHRLALRFRECTTSKTDLVKFEYDGVKLGRAVYDTYLRVKQRPTVKLDDPLLDKMIRDACLTFAVSRRFFDENDVQLVLLGHCVYTNWQIISDIAVQRDIDVLVTFNSRFPPFHFVNRHRGLQTLDHTKYRQVFAQLDPTQQQAARGLGRKIIEERLRGRIDEGVHYMLRSAFSDSAQDTDIDWGDKPALVFMLHSFSDSPHIYEDMVHPDFWEWLADSLNYVRDAGLLERYDIYLKPHPNRFEFEDQFVHQMLAEFPFARLLSDQINNRSLTSAKVAAVVTVYGTVASELTMLKVPVITCGDNPTAAYGFSHHAKTLDEYHALLRDAVKLKVPLEAEQEVAEFLYMHDVYRRHLSFEDYPFKRFRRRSELREGFCCRYSTFSFAELEKTLDTFISQAPDFRASRIKQAIDCRLTVSPSSQTRRKQHA